MAEIAEAFEDVDDPQRYEVSKEYVFDGWTVIVRDSEEDRVVKSVFGLSEEEIEEVVEELEEVGIADGLEEGELVEDTRNEMMLVVMEESGKAGEVRVTDDETVAEYTGCDEDERVHECTSVGGWARVEEKSREERLELVDKHTVRTYHYPRSVLTE
jgi:hypothetical protein